LEALEVGCSQLVGATGRVERVGEQQKAIEQAGFAGGKHGRLPASVGMAAEEYAARGLLPHGRDGGFKSLLVAFRTAALGWPVGTRLAKGQIAAEDGESGVAECACQGHKKRRIAVRSRAMGQDEGIAGRMGREMEEPANGRFIRRIVLAFSNHAHIGGQQCVIESGTPGNCKLNGCGRALTRGNVASTL
jgi:hypothetical protein